MLLTGIEYACAHDAQRLWITRPTPDGLVTVLDVPLFDVRTITGGPFSDDGGATAPVGSILIVRFTNPEIRWKERPLAGQPINILCTEAQVDNVMKFVDSMNMQMQRIHRHRLPLPDVTVPPLVPGQHGPERTDLIAAADRVKVNRHHLTNLDAVRAEIRPDEYVLELALFRDTFVVVTTLRCFVAERRGLRVSELPIDVVEYARIKTSSGNHSELGLGMVRNHITLRVDDEGEARRLLSAVEFAITLRRDQGAYLPPGPGVTELAQRWDALCDKAELGMVTYDELSEQASALLHVAW